MFLDLNSSIIIKRTLVHGNAWRPLKDRMIQYLSPVTDFRKWCQGKYTYKESMCLFCSKYMIVISYLLSCSYKDRCSGITETFTNRKNKTVFMKTQQKQRARFEKLAGSTLNLYFFNHLPLYLIYHCSPNSFIWILILYYSIKLDWDLVKKELAFGGQALMR